MAINVFLSVGTPFTEAQQKFVAAAETHLEKHGLRARTVGRNKFTYANPLGLIADLMDKSAGALVIALERLAIERGVERRGAPNEARLTDTAISTPWNQIEAALAYAKGIPLFVIKEPGVRGDGLLEPTHGWYVHTTEVAPDFVSDPLFAGVFESWREAVQRRAGWFGYRR